MAEATTWGVSVEEVSALAPHIVITESEAPPVGGAPDPFVNGAAVRKLTRMQVNGFINDITAMVDMRIHERARIADPVFSAKIAAAAKDVVRNGAGSYLVSAAFPIKAGPNENTSYAAELWNRYKLGLEELEKAIASFIKDGVGLNPLPDAPSRITSFFPAVRVRDDMRF
ncbi:putative structural protein [Arthrobacter phage vB_ArtM-ArV1]|uniref:Putative structural protein n=1 Tax=Arthrobacter phage vB_ArtM-ArV1 TaxID=1566993 RepID=A0A0A7HEP8_9CAUD|nr:putative structural protein [Arthrobacter phage vB_ArtM-ArV1]AIZ01699.1 putative structural protein [Arthrobacter phage vB_ArtM-ArV1]